MYTRVIFTTTLFGLTTHAAAQYSKLSADAGALEVKNSAIGDAVSAWQATETIVASAAIQTQNEAYVEALITGSTAALPAYLNQLPTTLRQPASSLEVAEAGLVVSDLAPALGGAATSTVVSSGGTPATTGTSMTTSKTMSGSTIGSSKTSGTTKTTSTSTGSKNGAAQPTGLLKAAGVAGAGVLGVMALL
ncbi:hypothetical protein P7C71_g6545, partial [Lecanoromycetidae sp. Uapishka_2]